MCLPMAHDFILTDLYCVCIFRNANAILRFSLDAHNLTSYTVHVQVHVLCTAEYGTDRLGNTHVVADHVHTGCDVGHSSHVAAVE